MASALTGYSFAFRRRTDGNETAGLDAAPPKNKKRGRLWSGSKRPVPRGFEEGAPRSKGTQLDQRCG
jgi:hypothetical protein